MMLPPAVDLPPPRPAHSTARPDSSPRSVISHGSHVTTRDDVPDVSPRWMPTRSPTFAVAAGTAAARVVTGIRRRYAVVPSRSPGMNSRATAYWSAGRAMVTCGANSLRTVLARSSTSSSVAADTARRNHPRVRVLNPDRPIEISSSTARALSACRSNAPGAGSACSTS